MVSFSCSIVFRFFFWLSSSSNFTPSSASAYTLSPRRHPFWYLIAMLIRSDICCWSFGCCCCGDADGAVDFAALVSRWLLPIWLSTSNSYFRLTVLPRIQITMATMQISSAQMAIAPPAIPASSIIIIRDGAAMYEMMGRIMFEIENFALFKAEIVISLLCEILTEIHIRASWIFKVTPLSRIAVGAPWES